MKKLLYINLILALSILCGCSRDNKVQSTDNSSSVVERLEDGRLAVQINFETKDMQQVETRANAPEDNIDDGWAFVFEAKQDTDGDDVIADDSKLLQKVPITINANNEVFFYFDEDPQTCYLRFMANLTDEAYATIDALVSERMSVDSDGDSYGKEVSTFADYKNLTVAIDGLYATYSTSGDTPDPDFLRTSFPMASPGITMTSGITEESLKTLGEQDVYMIMAASKIDVTVEDSNFKMQDVTLLNGALEAKIRSSVLANDGTTLYSYDLDKNLGGVTQFAPAGLLSGSTTQSKPIYLYPNEGGDYGDDDINPTYIVVRGTAGNYSEGYYKIAIKGQYTDSNTGELSELTYDIVRNTHFAVTIKSVGNAGYKTLQDAINGLASDVVYSIEIDGDSDNRNDYLVSENGDYYLEVTGSEVYIRAKDVTGEGVESSIDVAIHQNQAAGLDLPTLYVSADGGVEITSAQEVVTASGVTDVFENITFSAVDNGTITIHCGNVQKQIPVYFESRHGESVGEISATVNSQSIFSSAQEIVGTYTDVNGTSSTGFISLDGTIAANDTYSDRSFEGYVYPSDMSKGVIKLCYYQAANFELYNNNTNEEAKSSQEIIYQSTGNIYTITDGTANETTARSYVVNGDIDVEYSGSFSNFNSIGWGDTNSFSFSANDIGTNQGNVYVEANSHLSNTATMTLTNLADEQKIYTFQIDQYAAPYMPHNTDNDNSCYVYIPSVYIGTGEVVWHTCEVYNVLYEYNWEWVSGTDSKVIDYVRVVYTKSTDNSGVFTVERNDETGAGLIDTTWYGVFRAYMKNGAGETFTYDFEIELHRKAN